MSFEVRDAGARALRPWVRWAWSRLSAERAHPSDEAPTLAFEKPESELSAAQVARWRLEPLLYSALALEGDVRAAEFARAAREATAVNLIRPPVLTPVVRALQQEGVRYAIYKGAALTDQFPLLRSTRATSDVDVLVLPEDFHAARGILARMGLEEQRSTERVSIAWNNERVFVGHVPVELHVDLHKGLHRAPLFQDLARAAVNEAQTSASGGELRYAPPALAPLLIAAHRAKHGYSADGRELLDLRVLFAAMEPAAFPALIERAIAFRMAGALYGVWTVYRWWWGDAPPHEDAAYAQLRSLLGRSARWIDALVAHDCPGDHNKPWAHAPFLKMYLPMPLLTGHRVSPFALAGVHVALRSLDVMAGGIDSVGGMPLPLRRGAARARSWFKS